MRRRQFVAGLLAAAACGGAEDAVRVGVPAYGGAQQGRFARRGGPQRYAPLPPSFIGQTEDAYYVSRYGDDDNDGRSLTKALYSFAALSAQPLTGESVVYLNRGDTWPEELTGYPTGITFRNYGAPSLDLPMVDASDLAPNEQFTKTGGYTNIYQISWTHGFGVDGGKSHHRAWENGTRMVRAAASDAVLATALTTLDATPGAFWAAMPSSGGPDTIYVHASNSSDVRANGWAYHCARRRYAIQLYDSVNQASIYGLQARRNAHDDGSILIDGYASGCRALDGKKHCFFLKAGLAEDCQAIGMESPGTIGGATMFVTYQDVSPIRNATYRRCTAIADNDVAHINGGKNRDFTLGFFAHTDNGTLRTFESIELEGCRTEGCYLPYQVQQTTRVVYRDCSCDDGYQIHTSFAETVEIYGGTYLGRPDGSNSGLLSWGADFDLPHALIARGVEWGTAATGTFPTTINLDHSGAVPAVVDIQHCTLASEGGAVNWLRKGDFTFRNNIVYGDNIVMLRLGSANPPGVTLDADNNVYFDARGVGTCNYQYGVGALDIIGLAAWRSATGQDANSVNADPLFAGDFSEGDFTLAANSPAHALQAGADYWDGSEVE